MKVGVDIGGTFTDIILRHGGRYFTKKVSSTAHDYAQAILEGIEQLLEEHSLHAAAVDGFLHATTVGSNTILEHKGARTGLITTRGFRDVLELRTLRMPRLYDISWTKPPPLVPRYLRMEVDERLDWRGNVELPLCMESVDRAIRQLLEEEVESIAVCLLHSYANPRHERRIGEAIRALSPGMIVCLSCDVLPEIKEYERTSTTVINAYVRPVVENYLKSLAQRLHARGVRTSVHLMQSNGGLTTAEAAADKPVNIIESGPVAGVVGARALARRLGLDDVIAFDMGGTTAKASLIEAGEVTRAAEYSVGGGIMVGSRLLSGAGYTLKVPAIDLAEVGAGGGSLVTIDAGGALQVGPHSAGAHPGPVCYGLGNRVPTVTDANVILGYLNPLAIAGGTVKLDASLSRGAFDANVAKPLGLSLEKAAHGAYLVAAANMIRALKAVSSERGRNPCDYTLVGFGGNGPIFSASIAQMLGMKRVLIPPMAGLFSSFGLLESEIEYHFSATLWSDLASDCSRRLADGFAELERQVREQFDKDGVPPAARAISRSAGTRYKGQSYELAIPVSEGVLTEPALREIAGRFEAEHKKTYGHSAEGEMIEVVTLSVIGRVRRSGAHPPALDPTPASSANGAKGSRRAYFGDRHGWCDTPVLTRADLAQKQAGPVLIDEYDCTCVVPPGCAAHLDTMGNIVIDVIDVIEA